MSFILFAIACCSLGCDATKAPLPPVTNGAVAVQGVITLDGKPLDGATIRMTGTGVAPALGYYCVGTSDSAGRFILTGDEGQTQGAPPGNYKVIVSRIARTDGTVVQITAEMSPMAAMVSGAKESVPPKYSAPLRPEDAYLATVGVDGKLELNLTSQ